jgi:hypothetical protein
MLYLIKKDGKYALPYNVWILVKQYAGVYNQPVDFNAVNNMRVILLHSLYRKWFGRFILPDNYDLWNQGKRRQWLLKNLVEKNNYKMTEERYKCLKNVSNSQVNILE